MVKTPFPFRTAALLRLVARCETTPSVIAVRVTTERKSDGEYSPGPGTLFAASMVPPWRWANSRDNQRPMPNPCLCPPSLVVKNC